MRFQNVILEKATVNDVDKIVSIIQKRCQWLDEKNINQWNVTRTYTQEYYIKKIEEEKMYVAKIEKKIVRNMYDSKP